MLVEGSRVRQETGGWCQGIGLARACGRDQADDTHTSVIPVRGVVYSRLKFIFPETRIWLHCQGNTLTTLGLILLRSALAGYPKWLCLWKTALSHKCSSWGGEKKGAGLWDVSLIDISILHSLSPLLKQQGKCLLLLSVPSPHLPPKVWIDVWRVG